MAQTFEHASKVLQEPTHQIEATTTTGNKRKNPPSIHTDGARQSQKPRTEPPTPQPTPSSKPATRPLSFPLDYGALPPQRYTYTYTNDSFHCTDIKKHDNNPQFKTLDQSTLTRVYFFIRTPCDPTGSSSPCITVLAGTRLSEIFNWYHMQTYPGPKSKEVTLEEYCFMGLSLFDRTLGKRWFYTEAKRSAVTVGDTGWVAEKGRVFLVSCDRLPGGKYRILEDAPDKGASGV